MSKTQNPITAIRASFDALVPDMAADYAGHINRRIDRLEEQFGNVVNARRDPVYRDAVVELRRFMNTETVVASPRDPLYRDSQAIERFAKQNAQDVVDAFVAKLEAKLGDLDEVRMAETNGAAFALIGRLGDREIRVEQQVVFKVSPRGRLFHQFPARIYVDGRFTPEAKFKALVAA